VEIEKKEIQQFQKKILEWYAINIRDFPWRQDRNPYHILISEVMSQQTQISRVVPKYEAWLEKFPTIEALAAAKISEVLAAWSGLGYNRRALFLKKAAEVIVQTYDGKFPQDEKSLRSLPGIGEYTARALLCFAFDQQIAVVDTNVRKVILVEFPDALDTIKDIQLIAEQLLPHGKAYEWNQALMDYSSAILKQEKIPIPKQSKFHGSHRYYRGQILKNLLQKKTIAVKEMGGLIKKEYTNSDEKWLQKLIEELRAEGFIVIKNGEIILAS
jgi:A/G-specific adenine glycosylase